ncbi:zinc finger protein 367-like [Haemaphysalis longicornis]
MMSSVAPCSPPIRDQTYFPWNWHEVAVSVDLQSPRAGTAAGEARSPHTPTSAHGDGQRRGRPRLDAITSLIREGSSSPSSIKCNVCNRVFPREKSLQAHMRTHTGEKPYRCDFPSCCRAFAQSGQLKTHQRLHTGEKPFVCSEPGCTQRYTHPNRRCSRHPFSVLRRDDPNATVAAPRGTDDERADCENRSEAVALWLKNHTEQSQAADVAGMPKTRQLRRELDAQARLDSEELLQKKRRKPSSPACHDYSGKERMMGALALIELASRGCPEEEPSGRPGHEGAPGASSSAGPAAADRPLDLTVPTSRAAC